MDPEHLTPQAHSQETAYELCLFVEQGISSGVIQDVSLDDTDCMIFTFTSHVPLLSTVIQLYIHYTYVYIRTFILHT